MGIKADPKASEIIPTLIFLSYSSKRAIVRAGDPVSAASSSVLNV